MDLAEFDYTLPEELIAQTPLADRAASRMLVIDRTHGAWEDRQFRDLPAFLRPGDCLVLNDSRVFPARLFGHRAGVHALPIGKKNPARHAYLTGEVEEFGVIEVAADGEILGFHEKNPEAPRIPDDPTRVLASMGNYLFSVTTLMRELKADVQRIGSKHDFGRDILPSLVGRVPMYAYDFRENRLPGEALGSALYWRDVGTLDAYYDAQMDLCGVVPALNLYNLSWPIRTVSHSDPGAKLSYDEKGRPAVAEGSVISGGSILSGGLIRNSILGRAVRISSGASVED